MSLPFERRRSFSPATRRPMSDAPPDLSSASRRRRSDGPQGHRTTSGDIFLDINGVGLLLFETPSGFAIFSFCGIYLYQPDTIESLWADFAKYERARDIVWLKEFQTFNDKSGAINVDTGVNGQLRELIMKWRRPGQALAVGKSEYKSIIESSLGIPCMHNEDVMELIWGIQHLMHRFVHREKSELPKEDRAPMSQGLQKFLNRNGFHVKPEMVNEQIVMAASALFDCDALEKTEYASFYSIGRHLKNVSGIEYKDWSVLKLATAFKIICTHEIDDSDEMFSKDIQSKLLKDADDYKDKINKVGCLMSYKELVSADQLRTQSKGILASLVKKAKEAHEPELGRL